MGIAVRAAVAADVPVLRDLIAASVRGLQTAEYTLAQREGALVSVYGVDTRLIEDGTYFVVEVEGLAVACGGWSRRKTLFGGDHCANREDDLLDSRSDAAKIRAFFVDPQWARQGLGTLLLAACESAALLNGFTRLEMGATLSGVAFYRARGYIEIEKIEVPVAGGQTIEIVRMAKNIRS